MEDAFFKEKAILCERLTKLDDYTPQANDLLDADCKTIHGMLGFIADGGEFAEAAIAKMQEYIVGLNFESDETYRKTLLDLWKYFIKQRETNREEKERRDAKRAY